MCSVSECVKSECNAKAKAGETTACEADEEEPDARRGRN
jgi:hypothetical protein